MRFKGSDIFLTEKWTNNKEEYWTHKYLFQDAKKIWICTVHLKVVFFSMKF